MSPIPRNTTAEDVIKLLTTEPVQSTSRQKALQTIMKRRGVSLEEAKKIQAEAISRTYPKSTKR